VLRCSAIFAERMRGINGKKLGGDEKVEQRKISDFLQILQLYENRWEGMADDLFHNRQRTSTRSGILKAEADYSSHSVKDCSARNSAQGVRDP
jgi:hypothetical protein